VVSKYLGGINLLFPLKDLTGTADSMAHTCPNPPFKQESSGNLRLPDFTNPGFSVIFLSYELISGCADIIRAV
jgi:hypothetical protein